MSTENETEMPWIEIPPEELKSTSGPSMDHQALFLEMAQISSGRQKEIMRLRADLTTERKKREDDRILWENEVLRLSGLLRVSNTERNDANKRLVDAQQSLAAMERERAWIPCVERMPTMEDSNDHGDVLWKLKHGADSCCGWDIKFHEAVKPTHWMRIPPLPQPPQTREGGEG